MSSIKTKFLGDNYMEIIVRPDTKVNRLIPFIEKTAKANYILVLTVDNTYEDLLEAVGRYCSGREEYFGVAFPKDFPPDITLFQLIGKMVIDYYIPQTYFVKEQGTMKILEIKRSVKSESKTD